MRRLRTAAALAAAAVLAARCLHERRRRRRRRRHTPRSRRRRQRDDSPGTTTTAAGEATATPSPRSRRPASCAAAPATTSPASPPSTPPASTSASTPTSAGSSPPPCSATPTAVEFVDVETETGSPRCSPASIDVLVRNTTWTASRDGTEGVTFLQPTFYDGQGMMVATDSGITDLDGLAGQVVCVAGGTTTEGNVATEFARLGLAAPEILSVRERRPAPAGVPGGPLRRLVVGPQPAHRPALELPGRARRADDPRRHLLQGAAGARRARRRLRVGPGRRVGDLRHDPGRGVRHQLENIEEQLASTNPTIQALPRRRRRRRRARSRPRPRARLRRRRSSPRSATTARSTRPTSPRSASSGARTSCGPTAACSTPRRTAEPAPSTATREPHVPPAAVAGRARAAVGVPARGARRGRRGRVGALHQRPAQQRAPRHPHRLRLPRQPGAVHDPGHRLPPDPTGRATPSSSALGNTVRLSLVRDRARPPCSAPLVGIARLSGNWLVRSHGRRSTSRRSATSRCC